MSEGRRTAPYPQYGALGGAQGGIENGGGRGESGDHGDYAPSSSSRSSSSSSSHFPSSSSPRSSGGGVLTSSSSSSSSSRSGGGGYGNNKHGGSSSGSEHDHSSSNMDVYNNNGGISGAKSSSSLQWGTLFLTGVGVITTLLVMTSSGGQVMQSGMSTVKTFFTGDNPLDDVPSDHTDDTLGVLKPNVVLILADDLGWNSMGSEDFDIDFTTPTLSAMADVGLSMENYYAQEVCTPARASLLTGRLPLSMGMQYFMVETAIPWGMPLNETTIAQVLRENGYRTHMLGKWHLGHHSPRYLPTARGFDTYTGMLNGESYYWSKRNPDHPHFKDFIAADKDCYWPYDEDNIHDYSTHLYRDKAVETIEDHDATDPLFLFVSFQAVHDPFDDVNGVHELGIPKEYLDATVYHEITTTIKGKKRQQYAMSLYVMDKAVGSIVSALDDKGILENTYIIFSSDNGGCFAGGGKNGPLRGTKGSLFEGGVKVDAFIYSPLLPANLEGTTYSGLFHISDWFPTILELTGSTFTPVDGYMLDGVSHVNAWMGTENAPRSVVLYNYYTNVDFYTFNMWTNGSFAIRDTQYKLMHAFNSTTYAAWYSTDDIDEDDDALDADVRCAPQAGFDDGEFTYWLFDLVNDPYETTNLYYSIEPFVSKARESLYMNLPGYYAASTEITSSMRGNQVAFQVWKEHGDFIVPFVKPEDLHEDWGGYPSDCYTETDDGANSLTLSSTTTEEEETTSTTTSSSSTSSSSSSSSSSSTGHSTYEKPSTTDSPPEKKASGTAKASSDSSLSSDSESTTTTTTANSAAKPSDASSSARAASGDGAAKKAGAKPLKQGAKPKVAGSPSR